MNMKRLWKSIFLTVALLTSTTWLIGCFPVAFLQPPFGDERLFLESLIGKWVIVEPGKWLILEGWVKEGEIRTTASKYSFYSYDCLKPESESWWKLGNPDYLSYCVLIRDDEDRKVSVVAHLGKIEGKIYLVATLDEESLHPVASLLVLPQHFLIFRVEQIRPQLKLIPLDFFACIKLLKEKPTAVPHVAYKANIGIELHGMEENTLLITANPAEFRQFIKEYGDSAKLFPRDSEATLVFNGEDWPFLYADPASGVTWHYEPNRIREWEGGAKLWIRRTGIKKICSSI
jgi:hypothetical protein